MCTSNFIDDSNGLIRSYCWQMQIMKVVISNFRSKVWMQKLVKILFLFGQFYMDSPNCVHY